MTQKDITQVGNEIIRQKSVKVNFPLSKGDKQVIKDLIDTMQAGVLVGISAPQIGVSKQIFITQPRTTKYRNEESSELKVFINPKIIEYSEKEEIEYEGCGSVAESNLFGEVNRSISIDIEYYSEDGKKHKDIFEGFIARIIQHEVDHLNGVVFVDRLYSTKTIMSGGEYKK